MEKDISGIKMAMQTADSSNEQSSSSSSQNTSKSKSASVGESKGSERRHIASHERTNSVDELNKSISESRSHIVRLEEEMEILQQAPVHDGNGNHSDSQDILQQLEMVHQQQQQLLQVQLELQEQLKAQMVITQDVSSASTDTNSNVCHTDVQEHNNNNVHTSSCDNSSNVPNEQIHVQLNQMADFVTNLTGADIDPIHRAGLEELGSFHMQSDQMACSSGQTSTVLETADRNLPCTDSSVLHSGPNLQSEHVLHPKLKTTLPDSPSTLNFSPESSSFMLVKSQHNNHLESTPYGSLKNPLAKDSSPINDNVFVTPQPIRIQSTQADGQNTVPTVCPPIWTPLVLSLAAEHPSLCDEKMSSKEHGQFKHCSKLSDSALDEQNGNLALAISHCDDVEYSPDLSDTSVDKCRESKSESQLDMSAVSLGSLSLRANTPVANNNGSQRKGSSQSLYRKALLKSTQRFHEALLDEECALYTCRLQNYLKSSLIDRGFTNPVSKVLTEGDDMVSILFSH